jgi:hypothetical protein
MRKNFQILGLVSAALFLAGCSTTSTPPADSNAGAPPTNYRAAAAAKAKQSFIDPYSVRDATISQPLYASAIFDGVTPFPRKGWIVCIRANAKNRLGGYTGQQYTLIAFKGDTADLVLSGPEYTGQLESHCSPGTYSAFPEIEGRG